MSYLKAVRRSWGGLMLAAMTIAYVAVFSATTLNNYNRLWYGNFDLGISDQGIWLLSRLENPYLTTRGLHLFGDHASYVSILVAPLYWLWDDAKALIILHTIALAAGAPLIFAIAKRKTGSVAASSALALSYLMYPPLHYTNLDSGYHAESLAVPLILLAYLMLIEKRWGAYFITTLLALACKEEIVAPVFLFGLYITAFSKERRIGLLTSAMAVLYAIIVAAVIFPYFAGTQYQNTFHANKAFGYMGPTLTDKVGSLTNASLLWGRAYTDKNIEYVNDILAPVAYLPALSPAFYAAGNLYINILSTWAYTHEIRYHYVTPIIPLVYIALANLVGHLRGRKRLLAAASIVLVAAALWGNWETGHEDVSLKYPERILENLRNPDQTPDRIRDLRIMLDDIPANASVSASYDIVPQLSHRRTIYMYPNPFQTEYYGIDNLQKPPDMKPDYLAIDSDLNPNERHIIGNFTENRDYTLIGRTGQFELYKRDA